MRMRWNTLGLVLCGVGLASVGIAWAVFAGHERWLRNTPNNTTLVRYTFYIEGDRVTPFLRGVEHPPPGSLGLVFDATLEADVFSPWASSKRPKRFGWLWGAMAWDADWYITQSLQPFEIWHDGSDVVYPAIFPHRPTDVPIARVPSDLVNQIERIIAADLDSLPDAPELAYEPIFAGVVSPEMVRGIALPLRVRADQPLQYFELNALDRITPAWLLPLVDAMTLGGFVCVPAGIGCLALGMSGGSRRKRRVARGQCLACSYPLADLTRCPECGVDRE